MAGDDTWRRLTRGGELHVPHDHLGACAVYGVVVDPAGEREFIEALTAALLEPKPADLWGEI